MKNITMTLEDSMVILRWVLGVLFLFLLFSLLFQGSSSRGAVDRNYKLGKENNTYVRVVACLSSVSPERRTPDYVKLCYLQAEKHNNTQVEHFGDAK